MRIKLTDCLCNKGNMGEIGNVQYNEIKHDKRSIRFKVRQIKSENDLKMKK